MEAEVTRSALAEEISWVSRIIPTRPIDQVHNGLLIEAGDGELRLSGGDGSSTSTTTVQAAVAVPGSAVVPGRLLANIANSLPQKPVTVELKGSRLGFSCGRSKFELPTFSEESYPKPPDQPDQIGSLPGQEFSDAIWQVAFAAAKDDTLPFLAGVQVKSTGTDLVMVATDKYRLAMKKVPWRGEPREPFLIRAKTLEGFSRPVSPYPVLLSLDPDGALFGLTAGTRRSTMPLLDGSTYPDVERLVPTSAVVTVTFDVAELVGAVKRVRLVTLNPQQPIRLTFGNDEIFIAAGKGGPDANASESVAGEVVGERMETAFNPEYLVDGLSALAGETGRLMLSAPTKPALLDAPEDESYRYVIVPVRLDM